MDNSNGSQDEEEGSKTHLRQEVTGKSLGEIKGHIESQHQDSYFFHFINSTPTPPTSQILITPISNHHIQFFNLSLIHPQHLTTIYSTPHTPSSTLKTAKPKNLSHKFIF